MSKRTAPRFRSIAYKWKVIVINGVDAYRVEFTNAQANVYELRDGAYIKCATIWSNKAKTARQVLDTIYEIQ